MLRCGEAKNIFYSYIYKDMYLYICNYVTIVTSKLDINSSLSVMKVVTT